MKLTKTTAQNLLETLWDRTYSGEDEDIVSFLNEHGLFEKDDVAPPAVPEEQEARIYSVSELLNDYPVGTAFIHDDCGACHLEEKPSGQRYMAFESSDWHAAAIIKDDYPWNIPMKLISIPVE